MCLLVQMCWLCKHRRRDGILLGSGLSLGALLMTVRVREVEVRGRHGSGHTERHVICCFRKVWVRERVDGRDSLSGIEFQKSFKKINGYEIMSAVEGRPILILFLTCGRCLG